METTISPRAQQIAYLLNDVDMDQLSNALNDFEETADVSLSEALDSLDDDVIADLCQEFGYEFPRKGIELTEQEQQQIKEAEALWETLGDIPVNEEEEIDEPFLDFPIGTDIYEIWQWFEEEQNVSVAYLMGHQVHPITGRKEDL